MTDSKKCVPPILQRLFTVAINNDVDELNKMLEYPDQSKEYDCLVNECLDTVLVIALIGQSEQVAIRLLQLIPRAVQSMVLNEISDAMAKSDFRAEVQYITEFANKHRVGVGKRPVPEYMGEGLWREVHPIATTGNSN